MTVRTTVEPGYVIAQFDMVPIGPSPSTIYGVFTEDSTLAEVGEWAKTKWDDYKYNRPTSGRLTLITNSVAGRD